MVLMVLKIFIGIVCLDDDSPICPGHDRVVTKGFEIFSTKYPHSHPIKSTSGARCLGFCLSCAGVNHCGLGSDLDFVGIH